jgi:hypothetical protein
MTRLIARSALALLALQPALVMAAPDRDRPGEDDYVGESPERYAMVRRVEGDVRIRKGELDESLERGVPVAEGDVVESRGRGVLQLADGTRIGFAGATRFTVAALFKDEKGRRQIMLRLDYGRIRVSGGEESEARVRVDCPSGTVQSEGRAVFTLECERDRTARLKVFHGRANFATNRDETELRAGERVTVYSPEDRLERIRAFNTYDEDEFERWSDDAAVVRRGQSWDRVPGELRYYSDDLDQNGDWVEVADYGWCWRPRGVEAEWRPYWRGRWGCYGGGMTWVSSEPWGYVTYHHGRWDWRAGFGWLWIPGVYYSPAWVAWNSWDGYCGWAPMGYNNYPATWGYGAWNGYHCWNVVPVNHLTTVNVNVYIRGERHLIASAQATGVTTWTGTGPRPVNTPWVRTPVILRPGEANNSAGVMRAMRRDEVNTRLVAYDRQAQIATGRTVLRQSIVSPMAPAGRGGEAAPPTRFRDTESRVAPTTRPIVRSTPSPMERGERPTGPIRETPTRSPEPMRTPDHIDRAREAGRDGAVDRRESRERERTPEPAGRERVPEPMPRERIREDRSRQEERRPEPSPMPRERTREDRPRQEERRPEPAPMPRERPREERRPEPAPMPRQESRPAPAPMPRQEAPRPSREERRGGR